MKKFITGLAVLLLALVGGGGGYVALENFGGNALSRSQTLIGSSSNLKSLPIEMVLADATTTDASLPDGGSKLTQAVRTEGVETVNLNIQAVGGTATSSLFVRQMGSNDGSNYYDLATSTYETIPALQPGAGLRTSTSTVLSITKAGFQFDPGTATTSYSVPLQTTGYKWTRFIIYGEDVSTDPNDGVQAWIDAVLVDKY